MKEGRNERRARSEKEKERGGGWGWTVVRKLIAGREKVITKKRGKKRENKQEEA